MKPSKLTHLNIGCGRDTYPDWTNLDSHPYPGLDIQADLDPPRGAKLFISADSDRFHVMRASHVLEHISNILPLMEELHRIAAPGCTLLIRCPYGSSDSADEDPTHVRRFFLGSFGYFSQAAYGGASYNYLGDWATSRRALRLKEGFSYADWHDKLDTLLELVHRGRNIVDEFLCQLVAVKPIRIAGTFKEESSVDFIFPSSGAAQPHFIGGESV